MNLAMLHQRVVGNSFQRRLGPDEPTLEHALQQLQMAYVQLQGAAGEAGHAAEPAG